MNAQSGSTDTVTERGSVVTRGQALRSGSDGPAPSRALMSVAIASSLRIASGASAWVV